MIHRVRRLMGLMGLEAVYKRSRTSQPHPAHLNLLKGKIIDRPNQVWCADITYIPVRRGFLYLVAIMDWAHGKFWRSLKQEVIYLTELQGGFQAQRVIQDWFDFYNTKRPHSALEHRTPVEAYWAGEDEKQAA